MKKLISFIICMYLLAAGYAQVPRFAKYSIGDSGAAAYFPGEPQFAISYSEDSSTVYTADIPVDSFLFSIIVVDFKEALGDDKAVNENLLMSYLDYLQSAFNIQHAAGYGTGHVMEQHPNATGMIDFWEDNEGNNYQVKGWVDSNTMAVLLILGPGDYPVYQVTQMFLNGFIFPE